MKRQATYLKLILVGTLLVQVGCSGNQPRRDQNYLMSGGADSADHSIAGNAFQNTGTSTGTSTGNFGTTALNALFGAPDADRDNVADSIDQCEGTPTGTQVDAKGCPVASGEGTPAGDGQDQSQVKKETTFDVQIDEEPLWYTACKELGIEVDEGDDTDGDNIKDGCEDVLSDKSKAGEYYMPALNKDIFNGAVVSMKRFYKETWPLFGKDEVARDGGWIAESAKDESIRLTKKEKEAVEDSYNLSVNHSDGEGADSKEDRQAIKKFLARTVLDKADMTAFKSFFHIEQKQAKEKRGDDFHPFFEVLDDNEIASRGADLEDFKDVKGTNGAQYALVRNDISELIPFTLGDVGESVAKFSGFAANTNSLREDEEFVYIAETHIVVPTNGINLRVGNLVSDRTKAQAGAKAGLFYVMNGNNTVLLTTTMITNKNTGKDLNKSEGMIPSPSKCRTAHVVIAYLADSKDVLTEQEQQAIFSENLFYKVPKKDLWKPIPQEWMRHKPLDGSAKQQCNIKADDVFFKDLKDALSSPAKSES